MEKAKGQKAPQGKEKGESEKKGEENLKRGFKAPLEEGEEDKHDGSVDLQLAASFDTGRRSSTAGASAGVSASLEDPRNCATNFVWRWLPI
ncbi:hypothetical protein TGPRC2_233735B [Toxoplasma gondii TgCatPRC2]|uniref:Uncharacterized protein n=1 Tax=Toxoplasma gondii TgCatPRC2 TaxID=1130821 RepID=A0A151HQ67_TOXGO|nr:hypothetical protein TGPRC2_233735B [Toxoplasma gondii TgCatPRC2]